MRELESGRIISDVRLVMRVRDGKVSDAGVGSVALNSNIIAEGWNGSMKVHICLIHI